MTYLDLINKLNSMPKNRLNDTATVFIEWDDEYVPIKAIWQAGQENDVLDENHPYIVLRG